MVTPAPTLATAPPAHDIAAVDCPLTRARIVTTLARACGTLPGPLADLRRLALREARDSGRKVIAIAAAVGLSQARIYQLTATRPGTETEAAR